MKKLILLSVISILFFSVNAQMPAPITITPENATVYDEITLTIDTKQSCPAEALFNAVVVNIHSGITINGNLWQKVIAFDQLGINGQSTELTYNGDSTWSIVYIPADFYGILPNESVTEINCVFNGGSWAAGEGKDFDAYQECIDFNVPILPGTPPEVPFLYSIVPAEADQGQSLSVQLFGLNTHFLSGTNTAWLKKSETETIDLTDLYAVNDTLLSAQLSIPGTSTPGLWDVFVYNQEDDTIGLASEFFVNDTTPPPPPSWPEAITMIPENATAFDEITLTIDTKLSCPFGGLFNADSVMFHSGVTIAGFTWQYVVAFDTLGMNGQQPKFTHNGDSTWSLTFTPSAFYGITTGTIVEAINGVFNGGDWSAGEAKDYDPDENCVDFTIPLTISTKVNQIPRGSFVLFPNPVEEVLYIKTSQKAVNLEVISFVGKPILKSNINNDQVQLDVSSLKKGMYFIVVSYEDGAKQMNKFIKM